MYNYSISRNVIGEKENLNIVTSGDGTNRDKIQDCEIYVALVTPSFVSNEFCLGEMKDQLIHSPGIIKNQCNKNEY